MGDENLLTLKADLAEAKIKELQFSVRELELQVEHLLNVVNLQQNQIDLLQKITRQLLPI